LTALEWAQKVTDGYYRAGILAGDIVDIDAKDRSHQHWTKNKTAIQNAAIETIEPLATMCEWLYFVRGTGAHEGLSSESLEAVAGDFDNTVPTPDGKASWWLLRQTFSKVRVHVQHHTTMSRLWRAAKNAANTLAHDVMEDYMMMEQPPPHLIFAAHVHRTADSWDNYKTRTIILPAWQLATDNVYRIGGGNRMADIGLVVVLIEGEHYEVLKWRLIPKPSNIWGRSPLTK